jgi:nucleotide-binding universal stress UspA family protein
MHMTAYQKILVALDQTPLAEEIIHQACGQAQPETGQLLLLHCLGLPPSSNLDYGDRYKANLSQFLDLAQQQLGERTEAVRQWLETYKQQTIAQGIPTDWDWGIGNPGKTICQKAKDWGADLIIVGYRSRKGFTAAWLGSTSNYVVHHAPCSVLIIQAEKTPGQ